MAEIIECVPNFSEGRDPNIIKAISDAITAVAEVKLLNVDPGAATNRTVISFIGNRNGVLAGAFAGIARAAELIDMRQHQGAHPRLGATDVCPLIPISGISEEECIRLSHELAHKVAAELKIPVFLYEKSAQTAERVNLEHIRAGEYEGLAEKLKDPQWKPDYGPAEFNARSGATVIGVREFLIAYNINLNTADRKVASEIALQIREKGRYQRDQAGNIVYGDDGKAQRIAGKLPFTKAVGWYIDEYKIAQVSINLTNYKVTPPHRVFEEVRKIARRLGLRVTGSEIVGLVPKEALLMAGRYYLQTQGKSQGVPESVLIRTAIQSLGLNDVSPFDPNQKIIEFHVKEFGNSLADLNLRQFTDELSSASPAPGGGSVAALCGVMAASLTAMIANLTFGKRGYERYCTKMNQTAINAQLLKAELLRLVDLDTAAFNEVMNCYRLPKSDEAEQAHRQATIQEAMKTAAKIPLQVMETGEKILALTAYVSRFGNLNSISDAGVAALTADTAIRGAAMNVLINLGNIEDAEFKAQMQAAVTRIKAKSQPLIRRIIKRVESKM